MVRSGTQASTTTSIRSGMTVQDLKRLTAKREYDIMMQYWETNAAVEASTPSLYSHSPTSVMQFPPDHLMSTESLGELPKQRAHSWSPNVSEYAVPSEATYMTSSGQHVFFMHGVVNAPIANMHSAAA